jgi:hypothetical protein
LPGADRGGWPGNQRTQPGGEIGKFFIHAVFFLPAGFPLQPTHMIARLPPTASLEPCQLAARIPRNEVRALTS